MGKTQTGRCALCREVKELRLSHIIPHFVGRKLINTSPGNIRATNEPNRVVQDTFKEYMLCSDCEGRFSAKETWFANHVFNPYIDKKEKVFFYDESLTYFIASVSWRTLYGDLEQYSQDSSFNQDNLMVLYRAEQIMREYLLGKRNDLGIIQNHVFFLERIKSASGLDLSMNPSAVMHRSICSYTFCTGETLFTLSNLMGILIITFYAMDQRETWINTKVEIEGGVIKAENQKMESVVGGEVQRWMEQSALAQQNLSERQREKIEKKMYALGEGILRYPILQDLFDDFELKGE